eukprot:CAMPEP_0194507808 /NCGR_PEP_ID=MMETSP0253-20130528/37435_1 /TAXON_ID=2966 /ORGANISM="Noctiluca scintillans" /LENGTH=52 /DNA_ID=CAMNT_0039350753 /DNA_START=60 /DNA_END=214 /DNA_ORIENTATION=+
MTCAALVWVEPVQTLAFAGSNACTAKELDMQDIEAPQRRYEVKVNREWNLLT